MCARAESDDSSDSRVTSATFVRESTEGRDAMPEAGSDLLSEPAAAAAPVTGSVEPIRPCPVCGTPRRVRQTSACSDECRAALSRRRRAAALSQNLQAAASLLRGEADRLTGLADRLRMSRRKDHL